MSAFTPFTYFLTISLSNSVPTHGDTPAWAYIINLFEKSDTQGAAGAAGWEGKGNLYESWTLDLIKYNGIVY
jgi:hypothetical protein